MKQQKPFELPRRSGPPEIYEEVLAKGWGEPHPVSGTMMIWGPRNEEELDVIWNLVRASYEYATGHYEEE